MPFKVKEILLIANLYDAYSIEKEGRFTDHILGEYHQLNLTSLPRITGVSTEDEALEALEYKHFDLVILMMGVDKKTPLKISHTLKSKYKYIPVFLLLNNNSDLSILEEQKKDLSFIDKVFVWNGDSKVFFAMVKLIEDKVNVENDTQGGLTRVILLVEDSAKYYSRYLPMLYKIIMEQTRRLIEDVNTDDLYKVLKMRARPKILLASTYEEAMQIFNQYNDYFLCVISDVSFREMELWMIMQDLN
jgi:CheY-like chemotaxis protein